MVRTLQATEDAIASGHTMKIQIRPQGITLTKAQRTRLERRLALILARFDDRIGRVVVRLSAAVNTPGYKRCQLEISVKPQVVTVEHSDLDVFLALEHAASRAARSVGRAIELAAWPATR